MPSYNIDTITSNDFSYEIDISQLPGKWVGKLACRGKPIWAGQAFIVATNNYRASGGGEDVCTRLIYPAELQHQG